ncbi:MAG: flagellar biosynthesis anti-sigma factor FlgM [Limnochordia bacterium]|jgi:flagellar biosynthesis anti-sigma factor FlgM
MNARHVQRTGQLEQPQVEESALRRRPAPPAKDAAGKKDQVVLSEQAQMFQRLQEAAAGTPEVRTDRVKALRAAIARGQYHVPAEAIAEKMLERSEGDS